MKAPTLKLLLTGGGTGGHVYPALATLEALERRVVLSVLYVGTSRGIEAQLVRQKQLPYRSIWIAGFHRRWSWQNLLFPLKLLVSLWQSWWILRQFRPDVAVGTGGYVTGPILWLAARMGIPVVLEEQDVYPGITTRLLARSARKICLAFDGARQFLNDESEKIVVTGNPVRRQLISVSPEEARRYWGIPQNAPVVLVFGGSQGARAINQAVQQCLNGWLQNGIYVIWQTGQREYQQVQQTIGTVPDTVHLLPYIDDMAMAYQAADIVVCRAGAITIAELALVQKAAVLIPYPFAAGNHQRKNALFVSEKGAALTIEQNETLASELDAAVQQLLADPSRRQAMQQAWKELARPDAADKIADVILQVAKVPVNKPLSHAPQGQSEEAT